MKSTSLYIEGFDGAGISDGNGINFMVFRTYGGKLRVRNSETGGVFDAIPVPSQGSAAIEKVISERISQIERWGEDTYNHPFEWMSILGEEFGELCEAVNETCFMNGKHPERGGDENIVREATQIAAVAIAIIEAFLPLDTAPNIIPADKGD